jgi:hypothetical protein
MTDKPDLTYPAILAYISPHLGKGTTESRAFLAWFLETYYRLDYDQAHDAVCDGADDKGIDGIYVDDNLEQVELFQAKLFQKPAKALGDVLLKEFAGTLSQFRDPANVEAIASSTANAELRNLITSEEIPRKLRSGYSLRGVFVVNAKPDPAARTFVASQPEIRLYDTADLTGFYVPLAPLPPTSAPVVFHIDMGSRAAYKIDGTRVALAPLKATELVSMAGIASAVLFAWNVRQSLGRTKVNKDIASSIEDAAEHKNFLLFHNGLTILCESMRLAKNTITIDRYSVVNGCQSLTTLYEHRNDLSENLRILTRLIQLDPNSALAAKITHHSNNQNAINARDLQSNSNLQRRLQNEFETKYPGRVFYRIKRGEVTTLPDIIDNEDAARILLAFDLREPWACHQTYRLFDELHTPIFARPEVGAHRIRALTLVFVAVLSQLPSLQHDLMRGYRLTRYFLLYLLRQALETDALGLAFCKDPLPFLSEANGEQRIILATERVLADLVIDLNAELSQREAMGNPIDYKRELKSPTAVKALERSVIPPYQMAVSRARASSFGAEWASSAPS